MSGYGLSNRFVKFFFALHCSLLKKNIVPAAADFSSTTEHDWGSWKDFIENDSQNLRFGKRSLGEQLKSRQNRKGLVRAKQTLSLISLYSSQKRKTSRLSKKKPKPRANTVRKRISFPRNVIFTP